MRVEAAAAAAQPGRTALLKLVQAEGWNGRVVLTEAEIDELDVPPGIKQDVVRLDVAVDAAQLGVDVVHSLDELGSVEPCLRLGEHVHPLEVCHEVPAGQVVHDHVQEVVVLEGVVQADDPAVLGDAQRVLLRAHVVHLVLVDHLPLAHLLHGKDLAGVPLPAEPDDAEGARADHLDQLEVGDRHLLPALAHVLVLLHAEAPHHRLPLVLRQRGLLEVLAELLRHRLPLLEVLRLLRPLVLDGLLEGLELDVSLRHHGGQCGAGRTGSFVFKRA
mmetsp:Transcript_84167/g.272403  ORF Transcript_84167/g.272403 Transcript_84167/m.272403 type:complete len:274 (+) Transcript_84167:736-1557(+)